MSKRNLSGAKRHGNNGLTRNEKNDADRFYKNIIQDIFIESHAVYFFRLAFAKIFKPDIKIENIFKPAAMHRWTCGEKISNLSVISIMAGIKN